MGRAPAGRTDRIRDIAARLSFPVLMGGFVGLAAWSLDGARSPALVGALLTVFNFFVILGVEQMLPRNPAMNVFRDSQAGNDIGHGLALAVFVRPVGTALAIALMVWLADQRAVASVASVWPTRWPFAAQVLIGLGVWTFCDYWIHRSLHHFDRLWWFHAIHHDTPQMHILKSGRIHAGEEIWNAVTKPIPLLVLGAPPEIMAFIGLWVVFDGNLVHSNVDQRFPSWAHYFLPTVQLHNLHHAQDRATQDTNYSGSSAVWDLLFGTFSHPDRCPLGALGLADSPVPPGFLAQLAFPVRAQRRPPGADASDPR